MGDAADQQIYGMGDNLMWKDYWSRVVSRHPEGFRRAFNQLSDTYTYDMEESKYPHQHQESDINS
jgi:hypothetical protein